MPFPVCVGRYITTDRVVGISNLARLVDAYARRMHLQEKMTEQIANTLMELLQPRDVAVVKEGDHHCMPTRGVQNPGFSMATSTIFGRPPEDRRTRMEFMNIIGSPTRGLP